MGFEIYYDLLSQPSRAVYLLLKANNVDFTPHVVSLVEGDHLKPENLQKNPKHKVPFLIDDGWGLGESAAILRYIVAKKNLPEHWYPRKDERKHARVDEFLNWHHTGLRKQCVDLFLNKFRGTLGVGRFTKIPYDAAAISEFKKKAEASVKEIDEGFLKGQQFVAGDEISVADLIGFNELLQLSIIGEAGVYESNKNVNNWMKRVAAKLGKPLEEAQAVVDGVKQMFDAANKGGASKGGASKGAAKK